MVVKKSSVVSTQPTASSGLDQTFMNQIVALLSVVVPTILAYGSARGWFATDVAGQMSNDIINVIVAAIALGAAVWAFMTNRKTSQIARVARMSEVSKVVTTPAIAEGTLKEEPKVVSH